MSSNRTNSFKPNTTYHVTARAIGNLKPFARDEEKHALLERFGNHLALDPVLNPWRKPYLKLSSEIKTIAFNPMDNHLHNLSHQATKDGITKLMRRVMAREADAFNARTGWRGKVFSPFNAKEFEEIADPTQIRDMVAYIELNDPVQQFETPFASYQVVVGNLRCDWYDPAVVLGVFGGIDNYKEFMNRRGPSIVERKIREWGLNPRRHPYRPI